MLRICAGRVLLLLSFLTLVLAQTPGAPVENRYVNAKQCAGCHADTAKTYSQTGMARSFYKLTPATSVEDFTEANRYYHPASDTHYQMLRRGDNFFQRRFQLGYDGKETNVDEKRIDFVMGSGSHARTYLHQTARGTLMELPLGWYAEKGGYWAMSPGYDSAQHPGAQRPIGYDCMFCHNSYPQTPGDKDEFGDLPRFTGTLPEGIDCQRCHGPGQQHIAAAQKAGAKAEDVREAILNPKRLSPERQMEVCMQCHLQPNSLHATADFKKYGRSYFSYQPKEPLADFMLFFDTTGRENSLRFQIAGSAYRLRQSACYLKSAGKLECTTCHNPHDIRHGEEGAKSYNETCRQCHTTAFQALVSGGRHSAAGNCIGCHMPKRRTQDVVHVVMTDHLIQRRTPGNLLAELVEKTGAGTLAAEALPYLPAKVTRLELTVAQVRDDVNTKAGLPRLARELQAEPSRYPDPWFEEGEAFRRTGKLTEAARAYREALRRDPQYLAALLALGITLTDLGQWDQANETLRQAMELAPADSRLWETLGEVELGKRHPAEAIVDFRKATELDPDRASPHNALGILLARGGALREAEGELREAIRIQPNLAEAHANLADLLGVQGDLQQAAWEFRETVRLREGDVPTRLKYATLLYMLRRDDEAQQQAEAALKVQPGSAEAHHVRGNVLERKADLAGAVREYREVIRLKPEISRAQLDLGVVLAQTGDKAGAIAHLKLAAASQDADIRQIAQQTLKEMRVN